MKLLGIDYGTKKIGISISNTFGTIAFPYSVIENDEKFFKKIKEICKKENVNKIVLGKSLNYKRSPNEIFNEIINLKKELENKLSIPVYLHDETLTTQEAKRIDNKNNLVDASAAALILQGFLDKQSYEKQNNGKNS